MAHRYQRDNLDIAPFAYAAREEGRLTLQWEEPRDLHRVVLRMGRRGAMPRRGDLRIWYWRRFWPEQRATAADLDPAAIGRSGWKPRDDWYNGEWFPARFHLRTRGRAAHLAFAPLSREMPHLAALDMRFRQTMRLRIEVAPACAPLAGVAVFTNSPLAERALTVEAGCGRAPRPAVRVEVYNGALRECRGPRADDPRLHLRLLCSRPGPLSYDHTIVTLRGADPDLSFRPHDLERGPIWVPDAGVLVADAARDLRWSPEVETGLRASVSRYHAIAAEPEQTLGRALREQPPKEPMHCVLGCEGSRQRFAVAANGDVFAHVGFIRRVPGPDTPLLGWQGEAFALRLGLEDWQAAGRRIAHGCLPVLEARFARGPLDLDLEAFAAPIARSAGPVAPEAPTACLLRLAVSNKSRRAVTHEQRLRAMTYGSESLDAVSRNRAGPGCPEALRLEGDAAWADADPPYLRVVAAADGGEITADGDGLRWRVRLPPGGRAAGVLKLPFLGVVGERDLRRLRAHDFDRERERVIRYWERRLAGAARITTPDSDITDFCRAHLTHILINDERELGSQARIGRVGSFTYGNYANETIMQVMELDRRGLHREARRHLETFLRYQGTAGLPGNFRSRDGVFYGSGGYEAGGYNQHHGWVLWGLAEHYRFTGDRGWLLRIAGQVIAGCEWVIRERAATMRADPAGNRVLEWGFLPAGALEDVTEFCYWLSTNALTYRGLAAAAEALTDAGHPEGARLVEQARRYREDLLAGFREARARSPVVRLRDGAYVPHHPSRLYWRGRDFGWIREVLEGSINLVTTVLDATGSEATWVLADYEDNRYLDAPYNYPLRDFAGEWFSCGGFSMQPNLWYFPPPYLLRDQIEHFLRAFFNAFAACWRADVRAMTEHPLPTLAHWAGDHLKTSDEAMAAMWLRMMFIHEDGDTLYLGRGLPRAWLGAPGGVAIRNAATYFGPLSLEMKPAADGRIIARLDPPARRPPRRMVLRFRHPRRLALAQVRVNRRAVDAFDPEREWVELPRVTRPLVVEARFAQPRERGT